jgi:LacI family transcriptional regulator
MFPITPNGNVKLHDVAEKAGVSVSTASRCLTGAVAMAKTTRARVLSAADALGYRYNPLLGEVMRSTRRGSPNAYLGTLAYITPFDDADEWRGTPTLCGHWAAARARALSFGFGMAEFALTSQRMTSRRLGEILKARGITAVLLAAFPKDPFELILPWDHIATVPVGHMIHQPKLDCVVSDHTEAVLMAGRVLAARGYRRIGLALESYQNQITNRSWSTGYAALAIENPSLTQVPAFLPEHMTAPEFVAWVRQHQVDCVLTVSTFRNIPNHMENWLAEAGLRCPRDVGLASLDVTSATESWAGVDQNTDEIGKAAVDLVLSKVRAGDTGIPKVPRTLLVHSQWREGRTVRAV